MADPATIGLVAKAAVTALSDERTRKAIGWVIAAILSPLILIIVFICSILSGGADHNSAAMELCYYGGTIPGSVPMEYRSHIEDMRTSFTYLDSSIAAISAMTENGNGLDSHRVKAIFYSLFFSSENPSQVGVSRFVDCFVVYEERERTWTDEDGLEQQESYTVAVPIRALDVTYTNIAAAMGVEVSKADKQNADKIYSRTRSGGDIFSGGYERGSGQSIELDASAFINLTEKNNHDLVTYAIHAWESGWGYVWGTYGDVLTESLLEYKIDQYPDGVGNRESTIREKWLGGRTADCVGLIKGYGWLDPVSLTIGYGTNGMQDVTADGMYHAATVKDRISTMPDVPGLAVWHAGHIGIYIGNGEVIEAMGTNYGVVKTQLSERSWTAWLEIPYINYLDLE